MLKLVQHIARSSPHLYAVTSLDKLVVAAYQPIEFRREALHIRFDAMREEWNFEYFAMPYQPSEFVRKYERDQGVEKFSAFSKMINWL